MLFVAVGNRLLRRRMRTRIVRHHFLRRLLTARQSAKTKKDSQGLYRDPQGPAPRAPHHRFSSHRNKIPEFAAAQAFLATTSSIEVPKSFSITVAVFFTDPAATE